MKFKKYVLFYLLFIFCIYNIFSYKVFAEENIEIEAKSALLMETESGKIIFEKNSHDFPATNCGCALLGYMNFFLVKRDNK